MFIRGAPWDQRLWNQKRKKWDRAEGKVKLVTGQMTLADPSEGSGMKMALQGCPVMSTGQDFMPPPG